MESDLYFRVKTLEDTVEILTNQNLKSAEHLLALTKSHTNLLEEFTKFLEIFEKLPHQ